MEDKEEKRESPSPHLAGRGTDTIKRSEDFGPVEGEKGGKDQDSISRGWTSDHDTTSTMARVGQAHQPRFSDGAEAGSSSYGSRKWSPDGTSRDIPQGTKSFPLDDKVLKLYHPSVYIRKISKKWEVEVDKVFDLQDDELVETYKARAEDNNLTAKDMKTLITPEEWLGDEVINKLGEFINLSAMEFFEKDKQSDTSHPQGQQIIIFNTFIWSGLRNLDQSPVPMDFDSTRPIKGPLLKSFKAIEARGWSKKDILGIDSIFLPINEGNSHWALCVIRPKTRTISFYDSFITDEDAKEKLEKRYPLVVRFLRVILWEEYAATTWRFSADPGAFQPDKSACGVFVCSNMLSLALGIRPLFNLDESAVIDQRRFLASVILNKGFHGDFTWESMFTGNNGEALVEKEVA